MPEIEFFATDKDVTERISWLLDHGCEFIPDLHYDSNSFQQIAELEAIQDLAKSVALFHVVRPDFIESPIFLREVETADKHFFYISPRVGGPTLQVCRGRQFEKEGDYISPAPS